MSDEEKALHQRIRELLASGAPWPRGFDPDILACIRAGVSHSVLTPAPLVARDEGAWGFTSVLGEAFHLYGACPACEELNAAAQIPRMQPGWLDPLACRTHLLYQFEHRHENPRPRTMHGRPTSYWL